MDICSALLLIWKLCRLCFPNRKNTCCLPHQQDDVSTVCQSWVGLDTNIPCVLQILSAVTPFHQELYDFELHALEDFFKI